MKKAFLFLLLAGVMFACTAPVQPEKQDEEPGTEQGQPSGNDTPGSGTIELSQDKMLFSAFGGAMSVTVSTGGASWKAEMSSEAQSWITTASEEDVLTVKVEPNTAQGPRTETIQLTSGNSKASLIVSQDAAASEEQGGDPDMEVSCVLSDKTVIAPRDFSSYIKSHILPDNILILNKDIPTELLPEPGTKFIVNTPSNAAPNGVLGLVDRIEESSSDYTIYLSPLSITDVFKDLTINAEEMDLNGHVEDIVDAEGNSVPFTQTKAFTQKSIHIDVPQMSWDLPLGFSITPKISFDLGLKLQMSVNDYEISTLTAEFSMDTTIGADLEIMSDWSEEKYFRMLTIVMGAIPAGPVLITPMIDVYGIVGVDGKIGLSASVSTTLHSKAVIHYDEVSGVIGNITSEDPKDDENKISAGLKLEGGFSYGIGVGPSIGLFGHILSVGASLNVRHRHAISIGYDFLDNSNHTGFGNVLSQAEYSTSILLDAAMHLEILGQDEHITSSSLTVPLNTYKLFPPFNPKDMKFVQDGDAIVAKITITGPSLFKSGGAAGSLVYALDSWGVGAHSVPFDYTDADWEALWDGDVKEVEVQARITRNDLSWSTDGMGYCNSLGGPAWLVGNETIIVGGETNLYFAPIEEERALRGILKDLRGSISSDECNWTDDVPLCFMNNAGRTITIPNKWGVSNNIHVANHSQSLDPEKFHWEIVFGTREDGKAIERNFDSIEIEDNCFDGLSAVVSPTTSYYWAVTTKKYVYRSKRKIGFNPPHTTEILDISESYMPYLYATYPDDGKEVCATKIIANNCPYLESVHLYCEDSSRPSLEIDVSESGSESANGGFSLALEGVTTSLSTSLSNLGNAVLTSLEVKNSSTGSISLSNHQKLESIYIENTDAQSVVLSNLPALKGLFIEYNKQLADISFSGLPPLKSIQLKYNNKLKALVPAVIDDTRNAGNFTHLLYDELYEYDWLWYHLTNSEEIKQAFGGESGWHYACSRGSDDNKHYIYYKSNDYGLYYSAEPGCGYHRYIDRPDYNLD